LLPAGGFATYHEPFLGGAAVFFELGPGLSAYLSDLNTELIETYKAVRDDVRGVIGHLSEHKNTKVCYYEVRSSVPDDPTARAARFIYLNQTSFNGIYRVNLSGEYNVPYGYRSKGFLDEQNLLAVSERLSDAHIDDGDFDLVRERVRAKDLVFLDPPYTVSHNDNGFVKYNQKLFSLEDQIRLSELVDYIDGVGAYYLLTNAAHEAVASLFDRGDRRFELNRASRVGGKNAPRGTFSEYVFTNAR